MPENLAIKAVRGVADAGGALVGAVGALRVARLGARIIGRAQLVLPTTKSGFLKGLKQAFQTMPVVSSPRC